jgi:hypothetical protein
MTVLSKYMNILLENKLRHYPHPYLTDTELEMALDGTADSRYGKVKRLVAQGKLLHIRRGLYCLTKIMGYPTPPHPFELSQHIYAPSYISFESALAYHQLIPETVYAVTSACAKRSKTFNTPLGIFSYLHLPLENFYTEVMLVREQHYQFFIAKPWKAICDYVFCYKKNWRSLEPLEKSLRINREDLPMLRDEEIELLDDYYHNKRLTLFLKGIQQNLG